MARAIWNGVISFGMVSIPVGLSSATQEKDIRFNQIHQTCGGRIKQQKFCPTCDKLVESAEIVKGYEYGKGAYAYVTEEDFDALPVPSKHTIEITAFVDADQIDPLYFDGSYYLTPEDLGRKPFALMMRTLKDKNVAAIGKISMRSKENLCVLRPGNGTLILETLYYPDEIRKPEVEGLEDVAVEERELKMAESLVDLMKTDFEPAQYKDEYREALMARIEAKVQGQELRVAPVAEQARVIDLMDALKQSLELAKSKQKAS